MTDRDALLAAILADPADDTARLVYADALQECGEDERAEFIRVQVEIAEVDSRGVIRLEPGEDIQQAYARLRHRERKILDDAETVMGWLPPGVKGWYPPDWVRPEGLPDNFPHSLVARFCRGFVGEIHGPAADWLAHAAAIRAAHPVTKVTITGDLVLDWFRQVVSPDGLVVFTEWAWLGAPPFSTTDYPRISSPHAIVAETLLGLQFPGITFDANGAGVTFAWGQRTRGTNTPHLTLPFDGLANPDQNVFIGFAEAPPPLPGLHASHFDAMGNPLPPGT